MTCRTARLSQDHLPIDLVFCCDCGSAALEVCSTSYTLGPHLCQICAQSMVERGAWKDNLTRSPVREQPESPPRLDEYQYKRQRSQKEDLCSVNVAEDCSFAKPSMT